MTAVDSVSSNLAITATANAGASDSFDEKGGIKMLSLDKHTCDICYRSYSSAQSLKTHRKTHQPERSFQCETCGKCFAERSTLKRHMYIHLEVKPFKCDDCDRAFSDKSTLRRHIITHTGTKRFVCPKCDKRFTRNEHLRQHMYIHTCEKLYECEICHKTFRQRSTRKNHMLLHRADTGFKCETCGDVFGRQTLYDKHVLWCVGNNEDGFKCDQCDKRFQDRNSLKRHQIIHSEERPFKCEHCAQTFNDRSVLRRHTFTHTDRKPYQCHICQKDFVRKSSLNAHVTSQHPQEQPTVFGLVQPVSYNIPETLQFVIHNPETEIIDNKVNTVEVSSNKMQSDGVSILAQAVCNVPHTVLPPNNLQPDGMSDKLQSTNPAHAHDHEGNSSSSGHLQLQLDKDNMLQPGDNQLVQVQIIQMGDGNQFVQSIQAIVQGDEKDYREPDLVVDESHVMSINESAGRVIIDDSHTTSISSVENEATSGFDTDTFPVNGKSDDLMTTTVHNFPNSFPSVHNETTSQLNNTPPTLNPSQTFTSEQPQSEVTSTIDGPFKSIDTFTKTKTNE